MLPRRLRFPCVQVLVLLVAAPALSRAAQAPSPSPSAAPTLVLDGLGKGAAPLDGPWQFHLGDDPAWAAPSFSDFSWEQLSAAKPWGAQGHDSYTGYAWYRRHIAITPAPGVPPEFAIFLPAVDDAYQLYWNGVLVASHGQFPPHPVSYYQEPPQTFGLGQMHSGVLAVRVWKAQLASYDSGLQGGFEGLPQLGSPDAVAALKTAVDYSWLRSRQLQFGLDALYLLVAVLGLLAWIRDRTQWLLFWMTGFALGPLGILVLLGMRIHFPITWAIGLAQPVFGITDVSLWFLLLWLLQLHDQKTLLRIAKTFAVIDMVSTSLDGLIAIFTWNSSWVATQAADGILTAVFTFLETLPLILVTYAVFRRRHLAPARWLVAIFAFLTEMISVLRIASEQGSRFTHWTLGQKIAAPLFTVYGNAIGLRTIFSALLLVSIAYAVYRYSVEERRRQGAIEQEFKNARELQQVLVPETLPLLPGFTLTSAYRPAQEVGGDFFQIIPLGDGPSGAGSTLVILGDVSGKGLKAAMAVSLIVGATRMAAEITSSPAQILAALNRRLDGRLNGGFATCVAMRLDPDGQCTIASAGHPAPFLNDQEITLPGALPLGLTPDAAYDESTFSLQAGDHFALYTDGLLEARNPSGELFSFARLEALFATLPTASQASDAAVDFGQDDDITVLTLTRLAA